MKKHLNYLLVQELSIIDKSMHFSSFWTNESLFTGKAIFNTRTGSITVQMLEFKEKLNVANHI